MLLGILMLQSMETKNKKNENNSLRSIWLCSSVSISGCE